MMINQYSKKHVIRDLFLMCKYIKNYYHQVNLSVLLESVQLERVLLAC